MGAGAGENLPEVFWSKPIRALKTWIGITLKYIVHLFSRNNILDKDKTVKATRKHGLLSSENIPKAGRANHIRNNCQENCADV